MAVGWQKVYEMNLELKQKVVLVTGSSQGLGLYIAKEFIKEGANVILHGRDINKLEKIAFDLDLDGNFAVGDLTKINDCERIISQIISKYKRLDVLICNVGSGSSVPPGEENEIEMQRVFELNFYSAFNMVHKSRDALSSSKGSIVCISSICGIESLGAPLTYSVSKSALNSFIKGISRPFANQGIRVNGVAPGNIIFDGSVWDRKMKENIDKVNNMLNKEVALKRLGKAEEIASFVVFLSSNKAAFATGGVFIVDGGQIRS